MRKITSYKSIVSTLLATACLSTATNSLGHHSFAMYAMNTVRVFTGVVTSVDPAPNHLLVHFAPMNEEHNNVIRNSEGEPVEWTVEMQGSARMARQGLTTNSFPAGTVFSVALHPTRDGNNAGFRVGGIFQCPERTPPEPGFHCDSLEESKQIGTEGLPEPRSPE